MLTSVSVLRRGTVILLGEMATEHTITEADVLTALARVEDPEIGKPITELDMVNNLTRATVTYQPKETPEGGTPAAVEAAASQISATRQPVAPTAEAHATLDTRMIPLQRTPVSSPVSTPVGK